MNEKKNDVNTTSTAKIAETKKVVATGAAEIKSIDDLKNELAKRLLKLSNLKKKADNRERFLKTDENLQNLQTDLKSEEKISFESKNTKIVFKATTDNYHFDELFSISNVSMILKFVDFLRNEIKIKVEEIEKELIF
jgi:hypothetical protein